MPLVYEKHVFVCLNSRPLESQTSCANKNAEEVFLTLKNKIKALHLEQKIRINRSGCLGQCEKGLVLVVYPQGIWYQNVKKENVDEIIEKSLIRDEVIESLQFGAINKEREACP